MTINKRVSTQEFKNLHKLPQNNNKTDAKGNLWAVPGNVPHLLHSRIVL